MTRPRTLSAASPQRSLTGQDRAVATLIRREGVLAPETLARAERLAAARDLPLGEVLLGRFLRPVEVEELVARARAVRWGCARCGRRYSFGQLAHQTGLGCPVCAEPLRPVEPKGGGRLRCAPRPPWRGAPAA